MSSRTGLTLGVIVALADLEADLRSIPKKQRTFAAWLETADANEAELVISYLRDPEVPLDPLMKRLRSHGIPMTVETVRSYR